MRNATTSKTSTSLQLKYVVYFRVAQPPTEYHYAMFLIFHLLLGTTCRTVAGPETAGRTNNAKKWWHSRVSESLSANNLDWPSVARPLRGATRHRPRCMQMRAFIPADGEALVLYNAVGRTTDCGTYGASGLSCNSTTRCRALKSVTRKRNGILFPLSRFSSRGR